MKLYRFHVALLNESSSLQARSFRFPLLHLPRRSSVNIWSLYFEISVKGSRTRRRIAPGHVLFHPLERLSSPSAETFGTAKVLEAKWASLDSSLLEVERLEMVPRGRRGGVLFIHSPETLVRRAD